jgi:hypothetical protein
VTKRDRELLKNFTAVQHARHGNTCAWSVTGHKSGYSVTQTVYVHAMCNALAAIKAAIKQDAAESEMLAGAPCD